MSTDVAVPTVLERAWRVLSWAMIAVLWVAAIIAVAGVLGPTP